MISEGKMDRIIKKGFFLMGFLSVLLPTAMAYGQNFNNPHQANQEVLNELTTKPNKLIFRVGSNGCTDKSSFKIDIKKEEGLSPKSPHYHLAVLRTKPDNCKAIVEGGTLITFNLEKDLGLTGPFTYTVTNWILQNPDLVINEDRVRNYRYYLTFGKQYVQLKNGRFNKGNNPENVLNVELKDFFLGDLDGNGTDDAAVILVHNSMGSGSFFELTTLVAESDDDFIRQTNSIPLGDRIILHSLSITSGKILLDLTVHQPGDPSCCPTKRVVRKFTFANDRISELKD